MCGIVGIYSTPGSIAQELYDALSMIQHRGQDAAGITTYKNEKFYIKKGDGLVREVFRKNDMLKLEGRVGLGHVRYPTAGVYESNEAQPFYVNSPFGISLVHNGNLTNYGKLRDEVRKENIRCLNTRSDSELLLNVLADEILKLRVINLTVPKIKKALCEVYKRVTGSYSAIAYIAGQGMLAFRDPQGFRPLICGRKKEGKKICYIFASESVTLDILGYEIVKDVEPGEGIFIDKNTHEMHSIKCIPGNHTPCIFEYVYLARPDSIIDDISVYKSRLRMGEYLAKKIKKERNWDIDVVMPIPDSSRPAAVPMAHELNVKYREGLIKHRYIGRTFIMPGQELRKSSIRQKLNPIPLEIKGKKILLVDDSIVRGNTAPKIIKMVRKAGAKKIYFASFSPPLKAQCVYGVDTPTKEEFIAYNRSESEICKAIGADGLIYQELSELVKAVKEGNPKIKNYCTACFNGKYPTKEVNKKMLDKINRARGCMKDNKGLGKNKKKK